MMSTTLDVYISQRILQSTGQGLCPLIPIINATCMYLVFTGFSENKIVNWSFKWTLCISGLDSLSKPMVDIYKNELEIFWVRSTLYPTENPHKNL